MKKRRETSPSLGTEVARLRNSLHLSQGELAQELHIGRSAISACEIGRIVLAPPALVRLAELSPDEEQKLFFLEQAGLDRETIVRAADVIFKKRMEPPPAGRNVRIPQFRPTDKGLKNLNEDISLPAKFAPNPGSTISLLVDREASGVVSGPEGLYLVERPTLKANRPEALLGKVIVLRFVPPSDLVGAPEGIYIGRLSVSEDAWLGSGKAMLYQFWSLDSLTSPEPSPLIDIYSAEAPLPFKFSPGELPRGIRGIEDLRAGLEGRGDDLRTLQKISAALASSARLPAGSEFIGRVIGRLTGHLGSQGLRAAK